MLNGRNVCMLHKEANLVSVPVEIAIYCNNCETVSNSGRERCGVCGSEAILSLIQMLGGPPPDPDHSPASASSVDALSPPRQLLAAA